MKSLNTKPIDLAKLELKHKYNKYLKQVRQQDKLNLSHANWLTKNLNSKVVIEAIKPLNFKDWVDSNYSNFIKNFVSDFNRLDYYKSKATYDNNWAV